MRIPCMHFLYWQTCTSHTACSKIETGIGAFKSGLDDPSLNSQHPDCYRVFEANAFKHKHRIDVLPLQA